MRLPFYGGERTVIKRDAMLIRVKTDNGLVGYAPGPAHERAQHEIHGVIRSFLLGKDPRKWTELKFVGDLELTKTYCAVEIALIDLARARFEGCALSELIGGRKRDRIKLYQQRGNVYVAPEGYAAEAAIIAKIRNHRLQNAPRTRAGAGFGNHPADAQGHRAGGRADD